MWLDGALRFGREAVVGEVVWSYRTKAEWVEIGDEGFWVNVLQIPREALASQPHAEVQALRNVSKCLLLDQGAEKHKLILSERISSNTSKNGYFCRKYFNSIEAVASRHVAALNPHKSRESVSCGLCLSSKLHTSSAINAKFKGLLWARQPG